MEALGNNIILERIEAKTKSAGGIILTDRGKQIQNIGKVISAGPDVTRINVGDKICFGQHHGDILTFEGTDYIVLDADKSLARV